METSHRQEIAASVGAQQTLGPGYDQVLAEGLVERIGEEIDNRVAARLNRQLGMETAGQAPRPPGPQADWRQVRRTQRQLARAGRPSILLGLGSMAAAISVSAIVLVNDAYQMTPDGNTVRSGPSGMAYLLTALIWIIIGVINVAYARRQP